MVEFTLHQVLVASMSQVMTKSNGKGIRIVNNATEEAMTETLFGDSVRLQQVLADFLSTSVNYTPAGSQLVIAARLTKDHLGESVQLAHLELRYWRHSVLTLTHVHLRLYTQFSVYLSQQFSTQKKELAIDGNRAPCFKQILWFNTSIWIRLTYPGGGIPEVLLNQMFENDGEISEEGISLLISRKLVKLMSGDVQYLREAGKSTFIISVELAVANKSGVVWREKVRRAIVLYSWTRVHVMSCTVHLLKVSFTCFLQPAASELKAFWLWCPFLL